MDFCEKLIKKDLGITWAVPNGIRIDTLDEELVKLMKKSGLYTVTFGVESGSDRVRKLMNKKLDTETVEKQVRMIKKLDMNIVGAFMIGFPGETVKEINETIKFSLDLPLDRAVYSIFKPLPGTEIYNQLKKNNQLGNLEWKNFSFYKVAWHPKEISKMKLINLRRWAFLRFYNRPRTMFKMIKDIRNFNNLKHITKRILRWMI